MRDGGGLGRRARGGGPRVRLEPRGAGGASRISSWRESACSSRTAGYRYDIVDAALAVDWDRPLYGHEADGGARSRRATDGLLARLYTAYERCRNLSRGRPAGGRLGEAPAARRRRERSSRRSSRRRERSRRHWAALDFRAALAGLEPLCAPVDRLFDDVLIMAEDDGVRANRLSLLARIAALFDRVADFSRLTWD